MSSTLNKFNSIYMPAIIIISSGNGLRNEVCHRNQPFKTKLSLYKPLLHFYSCLQLYINNKMKHLVIQVDVVHMDIIHISRLLKEELAWAL